MSNILIVDGNNWFRLQAETSIRGNPLRECFNALQFAREEIVVVVWDGFRSLDARRKIYPEYKAKRNKPAQDFFSIQDEFKKIVRMSRCISVQLDGFEGDDVIAHLVNRYKHDHKIKLLSNDGDFGQLGVPMMREKFPTLPQWTRLYKTLVGDPSDNIPGLAGFGAGAWEKLMEQPEAMAKIEAWLAGGDKPSEECFETFSKRCKTLIELPETEKSLRTFYQIVGFFDLDPMVVDDAMVVGSNQPDQVYESLKLLFA